VRRKNLEAGIEVVAAIKRQGKSIRWMITGAPDPHNEDAMDYFRKLTALRRTLGVQKEVIFLCERFKERVSNDDRRSLFAVSDMLIFPSAREGFGIPVVEAGMAGLVLVLSDLPVLKEIAGEEAIYIRRSASPESVARRAIHAMDKCPRLSFRKKMIARYAWDRVFADRILPAVLKPRTVWGK
jgi:glycosyltransferase involved in cell wall biosynthesis